MGCVLFCFVLFCFVSSIDLKHTHTFRSAATTLTTMHPSSSSSSSTGPKNDTDVDQSTEVPHTTHLTHVFRALQFLHLFNSEIVDMRLSVDNTFSSLAAPSSSSQPPLPVLLKELDGNIRDVARRFFKLSKAASTVVEVVNVAQRHMQLYQQQQQQHEHEHVGRPGESSSVGDANTMYVVVVAAVWMDGWM